MTLAAFKMRGSGWQAVWTFIAVLAGVRTLGEWFRHGWSGIVLLGLGCVFVCVAFAAVADRRRVARGIEARAPDEGSAALRRRASDPILPGRRFF